ncbi:MAG: hypothetical protein H0X71_06925 [Rubrobacter sp.]|nr:hypothetical protein [Rubrobacter sp.]
MADATLTARGAFVGYLVSRTVGLLGLTEAELFEPMRIASLVVKGLFVGLYLAAISLWRLLPTR